MTSAAALLRQVVKPEPLSLLEYIKASGLRALVIGPSKDPNAKITVLLVSPEDGRAVLALKAPTTDQAAAAVKREADVLFAVSELPQHELAVTIPAVVDTVDFNVRTAA